MKYWKNNEKMAPTNGTILSKIVTWKFIVIKTIPHIEFDTDIKIASQVAFLYKGEHIA